MDRPTVTDLGRETFDLVVIGGGITGAHVARDAALRGLSVLLLEKEDFASGTSSRSTKLIHGGLRYLERFQFAMVRESCREREIMYRLAPHLLRPLPFIFLLYEGYPESPLKLRIGLTLYDRFAGGPRERRHRMLSREEVLDREPHVNPTGLRGGGMYYDALTDDARLTIETIKSAYQLGAVVANYMEVTGFTYSGSRLSGVRIADVLTGEEGTVSGRVVVNAAGPWVDAVGRLDRVPEPPRLRPTKGVHIVLHKDDFPLDRHALFLRAPRDGRVVWPIPAPTGEHVYVGTTDTDYRGPLDRVTATQEDVDYLLEVANFAIPGRKLGREHVVSTWAGLRPLVKAEGEVSASAVSREHKIFVSPSGLLTCAGGKLTTARLMGAQVVDKALELLQRDHGLGRARSGEDSARLPLSGGDLNEAFPRQVEEVRSRLGLSPEVTSRWAQRYGSNFFHLAAIVEKDPSAAEPLGSSLLTAAEVDYAVLAEMARTVADVLIRRTSLFFWLPDGGMTLAPAVAQRVAHHLGFGAQDQRRLVDQYRSWVEANRNLNPPAEAADSP